MEWTLADLVERVAGALSSDYDGQPSGRVSDLPDVRVIRYYTTLGLVDRPGAMRGRTALYGERHLWQLVAIKRLQAEGHTLASIQHRLAGASDVRLRHIADVPDHAFWRRRPSDGEPGPEPAAADATTDRDNARPTPITTTYQAVPLARGAIVLVPYRAPLTGPDLDTLRAAAGPLDAAIARLTDRA